MTPPMADLRGLIERVERAAGPDRGIDAALFAIDDPMLAISAPWPTWIAKQELGLDDFKAIYPYTRSIDAVLAFVEKMRPGYRWGVSSVAIKIGAYPDGKTAYGEGFRAHVTKNSPLRPMPSTADAPTPALAIILALLRSLDTDNKGAAHGAP